jgi:hypothetical protein
MQLFFCLNNGSHLIGIGEGIRRSGARIIGVHSYSEFASSMKGFNQAEGSNQMQDTLSLSGGCLLEA